MPDQETKAGKQEAAEADVGGFEKARGPFVVAAETTRMPMVFTDAKAADNPIIFANQAFLQLTGYSEQEALGQSFDVLTMPDADSKAMTEIRTAFQSGQDLERTLRCRRENGTDFRATLFLTPVRDDAGDVVQYFASFVDLSEHEKSEDRLRLCLLELNHRTQNALATAIAIAGQTLRGMTDDGTIATLEGRILALSKVHGLLGSENWDKVRLLDVFHEILRPFRLGDRVVLLCDGIVLPPKALLTLAMVVHELAVNARTHGALSNATGGKVAISCRLEAIPGGQQMQFHWQESGGPPVPPPVRKGVGSRQIEGLAQELNGTARLDYDSTGVICEIVMPVPGEGEWTDL